MAGPKRSLSPAAASPPRAYLDRPLLANKITGWTLIYIAIILFIVLTRFWDLTGRAYDHDESIHAWEAWKLATGQGYVHSPVYHGPFGYHVTALMFVLFGDNDFTGRLAAVLFGIAITIMPLFLRKWLGAKGVLIATFLMAISPVLMQRTRFFRHDHFAIFFNLVLLIGILRYLDERKTRDLYLVAAALSLGYTTKETTFITYFIYGSFLIGLFLWQWLRDRQAPALSGESLAQWPVFDLLLVMITLSLPLADALPGQDPGREPGGLFPARDRLFRGGLCGPPGHRGSHRPVVGLAPLDRLRGHLLRLLYALLHHHVHQRAGLCDGDDRLARLLALAARRQARRPALVLLYLPDVGLRVPGRAGGHRRHHLLCVAGR